MILVIHRTAALVSYLCINVFIVSTLCVELIGTHSLISEVKGLILWPGLFILVPSIALAGATGFSLAKLRHGKITLRKKQRMPFIGANGILVLIPCAIFLNSMASSDTFDISFYAVQAIEIAAGVTNLILMTLNIRDGLKLSERTQITLWPKH